MLLITQNMTGAAVETLLTQAGIVANETFVEIIAIGGGGSGAGGGGTSFSARGGDSGQMRVWQGKLDTLSHTVTIGQGGISSSASAGGAPGGTSSFGSLISVPGGAGGLFFGNTGWCAGGWGIGGQGGSSGPNAYPSRPTGSGGFAAPSPARSSGGGGGFGFGISGGRSTQTPGWASVVGSLPGTGYGAGGGGAGAMAAGGFGVSGAIFIRILAGSKLPARTRFVLFDTTSTPSAVSNLLTQAGVVANETFVDIIAIGGGAAGRSTAGGDSGQMRVWQGILSTLGHAVTIGQGSEPSTDGTHNAGEASSFGTLVSAPGGANANQIGIGGNGAPTFSSGTSASVGITGTLNGGNSIGVSSSGSEASASGGGGGILPITRPSGDTGIATSGNGFGAGGGGGNVGSWPRTVPGSGAQGCVIVCFA